MCGMGEVVKRAFKYRFYPTSEQADQLNRTFGCVRLVYNRALDARTRAWTVDRQRTTYGQTSAWLTEWKRGDDLSFLNEVSCVPLQQTLRHRQDGFTAFWDKRSRYPRFESKRRSRASAEYTRSAFRWRDGQLTLAKMKTPLAVVWSRPLPEGSEPSTVSRDSANRAKARLKVARIHARIADRRRDHLQKLTTRLVRENQTVVIEDLSVRNMLRNHCLARVISDAAWSELRRMLEYKAAWYGRTVIPIDRWYPSSKTCSSCGRINPALPLDVRGSPACGATHDRDINAATNILAAGLGGEAKRLSS
jgi:putative transposase